MNPDFRNWSRTLEPLTAITNTWMQCASEIARCNTRWMTDCISMGLRQCQTPYSQKHPEEWVQSQVEVMCESIEQAVKNYQNISEKMMDAMNDCRGKCEDMMSHQCGGKSEGSSGSSSSSSSRSGSGHSHGRRSD